MFAVCSHAVVALSAALLAAAVASAAVVQPLHDQLTLAVAVVSAVAVDHKCTFRTVLCDAEFADAEGCTDAEAFCSPSCL